MSHWQGAHEMILEMVAWRDPNLVSIKTFYGDSDIKVNFCGKLATDPHVQVCVCAMYISHVTCDMSHRPPWRRRFVAVQLEGLASHTILNLVRSAGCPISTA